MDAVERGVLDQMNLTAAGYFKTGKTFVKVRQTMLDYRQSP